MVAMTVAVLVLSAPLPGGLEAAKKHHEAFEFDKCIKALERAPAKKLSQLERAEVELYFGLCRFNLGQDQRAEGHFELALRLQPDLELPPMTSPKIEAMWARLARELRSATKAPDKPTEQPAVKPAEPDRLTPEQPLSVTSAPPPPPLETSRSFVLPIVFAAAAAAACVPGIILGVQANAAVGEARARTFQAQIIEANQRAAGLAVGSTISWALAGALAVGAVVSFLVELVR